MTKIIILLTALLLAGCGIDPSPYHTDESSMSSSSVYAPKSWVIPNWYNNRVTMCVNSVPKQHYRIAQKPYESCEYCYHDEDCHITSQEPKIDKETGCALFDKMAVCGDYTIKLCKYERRECIRLNFSSSSS